MAFARKSSPSVQPASLISLDDPYANGNDDLEAAQSAFERDREGPDPTMQMNPQWADWLDRAKAALGGQMPVFSAPRKRFQLGSLDGLGGSNGQ